MNKKKWTWWNDDGFNKSTSLPNTHAVIRTHNDLVLGWSTIWLLHADYVKKTPREIQMMETCSVVVYAYGKTIVVNTRNSLVQKAMLVFCFWRNRLLTFCRRFHSNVRNRKVRQIYMSFFYVLATTWKTQTHTRPEWTMNRIPCIELMCI